MTSTHTNPKATDTKNTHKEKSTKKFIGATCAEVLASFIHQTEYDDLPDEAVDMARKMVLDQLGGELASSVLPWNQKVFKYVKDLAVPSDQAGVANYGLRTCSEYAAFANATFGHGFEVDDFAPKADAHPGCVAVPASLAVGEREHVSGKDLLTGVTLASEVICRVGESGMRWMLARGFHETCVLGVFGAAAVAGKMLGLDPDQITNGLSIAGSHASGTREFSQTGGDVKRLHAGLAANGGIRSALLARNGLTGPPTILEGKLGVLQSFGGQFTEDKLTEGLGDRYAMVWNGFKPYCCSIDQHSYIDAMTRILAAHPLRPEDIAEIVARITPFEKGHMGTIGPEPHDITGAQLSVHFALGLTVAKRSNDFGTYIDAMNAGFKDPEVLAASRKVSVVEIPEPKDGDFLAAGSLTLKTNDGKTYEEKIQPSKGSPQNPMTYDELENKFMSLATRVLPKERASKIAAAIRDLEKVEDLRVLTGLLVSQPS